jgi:hypothetical protein
VTDIIAGTGRGEQLVLDVRSSAPSSPETHQAWIRDDLTSGEQIGALEFGDGTQVPIYPNSLTVEDSVTKALQVSVGGQMGFIPTAPVDDATYYTRRFPYNGVDYGLHSARSPIAIPDNTVAHYDASQLSLDDGDTVSVWPDEQGDNDLDIQTGSPTYVESGINGNPAIAFNGDGDGLEVTGLSVTQPNTTYLVFEYRSGWDDGRVLSGVSERQKTAWASPYENNWGTHAGDDLYGSYDLGIQLMTTVFDGANSSIREDGVETAVGDAGTNDLGGLSVGYGSYLDGYYADVYVSEIVIVNSGSVDLDFENQLLEKWGITSGQSEIAIPDSQIWQSTNSDDVQLVRDWWNDNWTYNTTDSSDTEDRSFVDNRHGATNATKQFIPGDSGGDESYLGAIFDFGPYTSLSVYGNSKYWGGPKGLFISIDGTEIVRENTDESWVEYTYDISGFSGPTSVELGAYNNDYLYGIRAYFSEFILE